MKRRQIICILPLFLIAAALASCGPTTPPGAAPPGAAPAADTPAAGSPAAGFPLTLTDGLGREVHVDAPPQRIISLAPVNTEVLFAVGAGGQVVGVTSYCNYPPEAQSREKVGGFSPNTINVETVVALRPDLVLCVGEIHRPTIETLEGIGLPVAALTAESLADIYANIELVGRLTGHEAEAARVVAGMRERVDAVAAAVAPLPPRDRLRVFWETWDEPLMTAGPSTFIGQAIELAGGINIFSEVAEDYPQVSVEEVVRRNPAVILGPDTHGDKLDPERIAQRPGWEQIDAVRNRRIHLLDGDIVSRPGPRLAEGVEAIARALYPDGFE